MKRLVIVVALFIVTGNPLHAQDIRQLESVSAALERKTAELQTKKMQQQIAQLEATSAALEQKVAELQTKLSALTVSGGSYVLNAGGGSVTIKANTLNFESTGALNIKSPSTLALTAGTTNITSGGSLNVSTGGATTIENGSALSMRTGGNTNIETTSLLTIKSGGNALVESTTQTLTLKARGVLLEGLNDLALKANSATFVASGSIHIRADRDLTLRGANIKSN